MSQYVEHLRARIGDRARLMIEIVACPSVPKNVSKVAWRLWTAYAKVVGTSVHDMELLLTLMDEFLTQANLRKHVLASRMFSQQVARQAIQMNTISS